MGGSTTRIEAGTRSDTPLRGYATRCQHAVAIGDTVRCMHIDPSSEQAQHFGAGATTPEPVFMLNLLRFRDQADGDADQTGRDAYGVYAAATAPHLDRVGGKIVWAGECDEALIGPGDREWDVVAVVRYPSRSAFLSMVGDPDYQSNTHHRAAGLVDSRLIPCAGGPLGS